MDEGLLGHRAVPKEPHVPPVRKLVSLCFFFSFKEEEASQITYKEQALVLEC